MFVFKLIFCSEFSVHFWYLINNVVYFSDKFICFRHECAKIYQLALIFIQALYHHEYDSLLIFNLDDNQLEEI